MKTSKEEARRLRDEMREKIISAMNQFEQITGLHVSQIERYVAYKPSKEYKTLPGEPYMALRVKIVLRSEELL